LPLRHWVNAVGNSNYPKNEEGTKVVGNKETEPVILANPEKTETKRVMGFHKNWR